MRRSPPRHCLGEFYRSLAVAISCCQGCHASRPRRIALTWMNQFYSSPGLYAYMCMYAGQLYVSAVRDLQDHAATIHRHTSSSQLGHSRPLGGRQLGSLEPQLSKCQALAQAHASLRHNHAFATFASNSAIACYMHVRRSAYACSIMRRTSAGPLVGPAQMLLAYQYTLRSFAPTRCSTRV